jgi:hypoxanthine-guanine phosphoribosyltransferase
MIWSPGKSDWRISIGERLGHELQYHYQGRDLVMIELVSGGGQNVSTDLLRWLPSRCRLKRLLANHASGAGSDLAVRLVRVDEAALKDLDITGREVVVVDYKAETRQKLDYVVRRLQDLGPISIMTCVLLDIYDRRMCGLNLDFVGMPLPARALVSLPAWPYN